MPKKPRVDRIPDDWQQRVMEHIENRPVENCPVALRDPMIRWLNDHNVQVAAGILWEEWNGNPTIRDDFHVILYRALYGVAYGSLQPPLPNWNRRKYEQIAGALEEASGHPFFRVSSSPEEKEKMDVAVVFFRAMGKVSSETKSKENGQRMVLVGTCEHFHRVFGRHMYDAVGLLMEVGFKGSWSAERVKARYSAWRNRAPGRRTS